MKEGVPVHDTAVAGDDVPEVLDLEGALEAAGEEAAEGPDDGGKQGEEEGVQEEGEHRHRGLAGEGGQVIR